jgi:hypothetical protein
MIGDHIYIGDEVNHLPTMVTKPPAFFVQLFSFIKKTQEDIILLADPRNYEDAVEIYICYLPDYYQSVITNTSELI